MCEDQEFLRRYREHMQKYKDIAQRRADEYALGAPARAAAAAAADAEKAAKAAAAAEKAAAERAAANARFAAVEAARDARIAARDAAYAALLRRQAAIVPMARNPGWSIAKRFYEMKQLIQHVLGIQLPENATCIQGGVGPGQSGTLSYGTNYCDIVISNRISDPVDLNGTIAHKIVQWHVRAVQQVREKRHDHVMQAICELAAIHFAGPSDLSNGLLSDHLSVINASKPLTELYQRLLKVYPALDNSDINW
jgi:nucleoid-associated protein YgaU